jgi:DNA-binding transcriptional LysR family regulator
MVAIMQRDIRTLDLNLLRALDALLETRNVTRAAEKLGLTQPAVSGILTRLREAFDDPLFVRGPRGVTPTPRALKLAEPVRRVLGEIAALLQPERFEPATADFTLRIAATDYALQVLVLPFLVRLRQCAPNVRLAVSPAETERVADQFDAGEIDLALMTPETTPAGLFTRRLFDESYACALRADHPDAKAKKLSLARFCARDHALVSLSGQNFHGVTDEALAKLGQTRRVVLSVTSFLALAEALRATDLIAVAPRRLIAGCVGLALHDPPLALPGFVKIAAWSDRTHHDPGHAWARALLFDTAAHLAPSEG